MHEEVLEDAASGVDRYNAIGRYVTRLAVLEAEVGRIVVGPDVTRVVRPGRSRGSVRGHAVQTRVVASDKQTQTSAGVM